MKLTVGCHKGGVGKTTTAVLLALQLAQQGPTLLVDGDRQGSASTWRRMAGEDWPELLEVVPWSDPLPQLLEEHHRGVHPGLSHVVIDTGPGDPARLAAALQVSDTALIPIGSRKGDVVQAVQTIRTVAEAARDRRLSWAVLVTMRRGSTTAARQAPAVLERDGLPLLGTEIPLTAAIADAFGTAPARIPGSYVDLYREITGAPARV